MAWKHPLPDSTICETVYSATGTAFAAHAENTRTPLARKGRAKACTEPAP